MMKKGMKIKLRLSVRRLVMKAVLLTGLHSLIKLKLLTIYWELKNLSRHLLHRHANNKVVFLKNLNNQVLNLGMIAIQMMTSCMKLEMTVMHTIVLSKKRAMELKWHANSLFTYVSNKWLIKRISTFFNVDKRNFSLRVFNQYLVISVWQGMVNCNKGKQSRCLVTF